MAKDPAFLFYYQDFLVGTSFMTLEEIGAYIKLLCFLADRKSLTETQILKKIPAPIWSAICCKFKKDENGFFNERLRLEVQKRRLFTESRRNNLHMNTHMDTHMKKHMENENENVIKDVVKIKRTIPPLVEDVVSYCKERKNNVDPETWFNHYASKGWFIGKSKMVDWKAAVRTWEKTSIQTGFKQATQSQVRKDPRPSVTCDNCKGTGKFKDFNTDKILNCWCVS